MSVRRLTSYYVKSASSKPKEGMTAWAEANGYLAVLHLALDNLVARSAVRCTSILFNHS